MISPLLIHAADAIRTKFSADSFQSVPSVRFHHINQGLKFGLVLDFGNVLPMDIFSRYSRQISETKKLVSLLSQTPSTRADDLLIIKGDAAAVSLCDSSPAKKIDIESVVGTMSLATKDHDAHCDHTNPIKAYRELLTGYLSSTSEYLQALPNNTETASQDTPASGLNLASYYQLHAALYPLSCGDYDNKELIALIACSNDIINSCRLEHSLQGIRISIKDQLRIAGQDNRDKTLWTRRLNQKYHSITESFNHQSSITASHCMKLKKLRQESASQSLLDDAFSQYGSDFCCPLVKDSTMQFEDRCESAGRMMYKNPDHFVCAVYDQHRLIFDQETMLTQKLSAAQKSINKWLEISPKTSLETKRKAVRKLAHINADLQFLRTCSNTNKNLFNDIIRVVTQPTVSLSVHQHTTMHNSFRNKKSFAH